MSGMIITVFFRIVDNPHAGKGYKTYEFDHPIHGKKRIGCFRVEKPEDWTDAIRSFNTNCGHGNTNPCDNFNFIRQEN
jgi:hypothetical protein